MAEKKKAKRKKKKKKDKGEKEKRTLSQKSTRDTEKRKKAPQRHSGKTPSCAAKRVLRRVGTSTRETTRREKIKNETPRDWGHEVCHHKKRGQEAGKRGRN